MKWLLRDMRDFGEGYVATLLVLVAVLMAMCAAGCNNPKARPFGREPEHWMDTHVWMDEDEGQVRLDNRAKPADGLWDYMTR